MTQYYEPEARELEARANRSNDPGEQNRLWAEAARIGTRVPDIEVALEAFHDALDEYGPYTRNSHGDDWVDCGAQAVVEALLDAGWRLP